MIAFFPGWRREGGEGDLAPSLIPSGATTDRSEKKIDLEPCTKCLPRSLAEQGFESPSFIPCPRREAPTGPGVFILTPAHQPCVKREDFWIKRPISSSTTQPAAQHTSPEANLPIQYQGMVNPIKRGCGEKSRRQTGAWRKGRVFCHKTYLIHQDSVQ